MRKFVSFFLLVGLMAWAGVANAQQEYTVRVGTPTDSSHMYPSNTIYRCSYTQMIFPYSLMPSVPDFKINEISFYYTGTGASSSARSQNWTVYMKNVSTLSFANDSAYIPVTSSDRVFVGKFNIPSSAGWVTIKLDKQFIYKNSYGNHLLVAIYDSTSPYSTRNFRITRGSDYYSLQYLTDSLNYSPNPERNLNSFRGTGRYKIRQKYMPVMKLGYNYDTAATLPYTTNFTNTNDNLKWYLKNYPDGNNAKWAFNGDLHCGDDAYPDYFTSGHPVTALAERLIQLDNSDSIKVSFYAMEIGGEDAGTEIYDFMSVYLIPKDTVWSPSRYATYYTGESYDDVLPYVLNFDQIDLLHSVKLTGISNEQLTATIANPFPNQQCKLVFVWQNDNSGGDATAARIDNLSVTGVNRAPEYTPQSTAQWYAYAYWLKGENYYPWQEHFIRFSMQNLANVDTASAHFDHDMYSGTYAGGYVWYNQGDNDKITRANISNNFVSGSINYTIPTLTGVIVAMQYNPADNKMYFITSDKKLCSFDISDPEHYTVMGQLSISITAFAINARGEAYVIEDESNGSLYRINLNNGTTTLVGSSGIHIEDYSAMAFDYSTGELFLALYDDDDNDDNYSNTAMFYVNTSNGEMKYIGKLLDRIVEVSALFAVQTVTPQGIATAQAAELSVYPNPAKDELHVNGVENGTMLLVYDMTGKIVAQQTATVNTVINVSGLNKGVYVVAAGERKIKFVKE